MKKFSNSLVFTLVNLLFGGLMFLLTLSTPKISYADDGVKYGDLMGADLGGGKWYYCCADNNKNVCSGSVNCYKDRNRSFN